MGTAARVVLASMPFGVLDSPSLALGTLQARLRDAGIAADCRHLTVDYAAHIGVDAYHRIASGFPNTESLLGEWIFSHALHFRSSAQQQAYLRAILRARRAITMPTMPYTGIMQHNSPRADQINECSAVRSIDALASCWRATWWCRAACCC
jgi:hypothetical protein